MTTLADGADAGRRSANTGWTTRALAAPAAVAAAAVSAVVMVGVRDPHVAGSYPACPSIALFGAYCPGCGSMRAMHEFAHADIAGMFSRNVLVPVGLVLLAWAWLAWVDQRVGLGRVRPLSAPAPVLYAAAAGLVLFAVLRNLPYAPFDALAP